MKFQLLASFTLVAVFSGCTTTVHYNPDYLEHAFKSVEPSIDGKALIVTEEKNDYRFYSQSPSSLTGAALKTVGNFGQHLSEIAQSYFDRSFTVGAAHSNEVSANGNYRLIIQPEIVRFDYRYNGLKNLFFAITPESKLDLYVAVYDGDGVMLFEKKYVSDYVSGGTYLVSFKPAEKINKSIHKALLKLMTEVSEDIESELYRKQVPEA